MAKPTRKKEPSGREHLRDFHRTVSGEYVYHGAVYRFQGDGAAWRQLKLRLGALAAVVLLAEIVSGWVKAPGSLRCAYVLLPAVCALAAAVSLVWGYVRLTAGGPDLRAYVYAATVERFPLRSALVLAFSAAAIAGEIVYVFRHGVGDLRSGMAVFLASQTIALVCAMLWRTEVRKGTWTYEETERTP